MKNKILLIGIILTFTLVMLLPTSVSATTATLDTIAAAFNSSEFVSNFENLVGCEYTAEVNENVLTIDIATGELGDSVDFTLDGNILSCDTLTQDTIFVAGFLVDCIGQINGEYEDGELYQNLNLFADEVGKYTVAKEGFEVAENEGTYTAKMDITKAVPLIDLSEFYLKPEEFDTIEEIIEEDSCGNQSGRNSRLAYNVSIGTDEDEIWMGEVDEITESTYKSILSAIEVMYGEDAVAWFKETYPDFSEGNCQYNGFSIDVDEDIDFDEHPMFSGTHVVILTFNKEYMKLKFCRTEYIGEAIDKGNKTITLDFVKDKSYELGFFDSATSSDAAFFFKYILSPAASTLEGTPEDNTVYFNVQNGKVVLGDKDNSVIKVVLGDSSLTILPVKTDVVTTTVTATHNDVKVTEYKYSSMDEIEEELGEVANSIDFFDEMVRYLKYNVTVNITYGELEEEEEDEPVVYKTLEGEGQKVDKTKKATFIFKFDIDFEKFKADGKVYMDGKPVDSSKYKATAGSTVITFNEDYAQDLAEGEHTLKVAVADGEATTKFTVEKTEEAKEETKETEETKKANNPMTGDDVVKFVVLLAISLTGTIAIELKRRK